MESMDEVESRLTAIGFVDFEELGGWCPVQITARHKDGWGVYLRARHDKVGVWICNDPKQILSLDFIVKTFVHEFDHDVGRMPVGEALEIFINDFNEFLGGLDGTR